MRNITKTLTALAAATALILTPAHSAHASSLPSLSSSSRKPSIPEESVGPEVPVDYRPVGDRLVEAAEEGLTAAGFIVDPKLSDAAQVYVDRQLSIDEMRVLIKEAGYDGGWGVSSSSGYSYHWEADILEFQEGRHFTANYHHSHVGVAISEPNFQGRSLFVIVNAGEKVRSSDDEENLLTEPPVDPSEG